MKYARISSENEKVLDGRTNDIKEEKKWNEHRNTLLDKKSCNIISFCLLANILSHKIRP